MAKNCRRVAPCVSASPRLCVTLFTANFPLIHHLKQDTVAIPVDFYQAGIELGF
jgi:hypothetical protein